MIAESEKVQKAPTSLPTEDLPQVQRLALTGYDFNHAVHLVLRVKHAIRKPGAAGQEWDANKQREAAERARTAAARAREFLTELLQREDLTFGDRARGDEAINVGFTYRGLEALELSERYLKELAVKAPAFRQGAPARAARHLGDFGASAAERWDGVFRWDNAHVLISSHAVSADLAIETARELASLPGAQEGFDGWDESDWLRAAHLSTNSRNRTVHFGFRDNIARPVIAGASSNGGKPCHSAGELLLGHPNDQDFNRWGDDRTAEEVARFFRNSSFCVLRKIEQHEKLLNDFLRAQASKLRRRALRPARGGGRSIANVLSEVPEGEALRSLAQRCAHEARAGLRASRSRRGRNCRRTRNSTSRTITARIWLSVRRAHPPDESARRQGAATAATSAVSPRHALRPRAARPSNGG